MGCNGFEPPLVDLQSSVLPLTLTTHDRVFNFILPVPGGRKLVIEHYDGSRTHTLRDSGGVFIRKTSHAINPISNIRPAELAPSIFIILNT